MSKVKGCRNRDCEAQKKKIVFKTSVTYCPLCGEPLVFVCKDCYTQLLDSSQKYCLRCIEKREDSKAKFISSVKSVGTLTLLVGGAVITLSEKVMDFVRKLKDN